MTKAKFIKYGILIFVLGLLIALKGDFLQFKPTKLTTSLHQTNQYSVVGINDGDTIVVSNGLKKLTVRLIGVDTPEVVDPRKPVQCFGREASEFTKTQLKIGAKVNLELDETQGEIDKYGRTLAYVILVDGTNFNKKIIEEGYGQEYTYQNNKYKYHAEFIGAQDNAKVQRRGLWNDKTCGGDTKQPA